MSIEKLPDHQEKQTEYASVVTKPANDEGEEYVTPVKYHDADAYFFDQIERSVLDREIKIAKGMTARKNIFDNNEGTLEAFLATLAKYETGDKDGECILQGQLVDGVRERRSATMAKNHFMIFDVDNGITFKEMSEKLWESGYLVLMYATHSHLKSQTDILQKDLVNYARNKGRDLATCDDTQILELGCAYLKDERNYLGRLLEEVRYGGSAPGPKGVVYKILHAPIDKFRIVFPLHEAYDFVGVGIQTDRIEHWKALYATVAEHFCMPFDKSCTDPSHLMYAPRIPKRADKSNYPMVLLGSDKLLDLAEFEEAAKNQKQRRPHKGSGRQLQVSPNGKAQGEFKTKNLKKFASLAAQDFEFADFMIDKYGEDNIRRAVTEGRYDFRCPREDHHTDITSDDTAFHVVNASANDGKGFAAWCLHNGCKEHWRSDRLRVLDTICQELGITDAIELITPEWTPNTQRPQGRSGWASENEVTPQEINDKINTLDRSSNPEAIEEVIALIATRDVSPHDHDFAVKIKGCTGRGVKDLKECISAARANLRKARKVEREERSEETKIPADLGSARLVMHDWGHNKVVVAIKEIALQLNRENPRIFTRSDGQTYRLLVASDSMDPVLKRATLGHWRDLLIDVKYMKCDNFSGELTNHPVPETVISHLLGDALFGQLPRLKSIVRVPVFNKEGRIITQRGYDPESQLYLIPNMEYRKVPTDKTAKDHVEWAKLTLFEAYRDFPFSDKFRNSVDELPIYSDQMGEDDFPIPNWERGKSSRAHAIVMTLQPFVRLMIDGPTPMYFIDKSRPAAGAGFLANVANIALDGRPATPQRMSQNDEEFAKSISASLFGGSNMIFIDNVVGKIDSPTLAAAITTGVWKDRVLGKSEMISVPIDGTWIIAGNNVSFTHELVRRLVPIRLDPAVERPEARPPTMFKHRMPRDFIEMREDLVFACHILIQNWIDKGCKPGKQILNSFDGWSEVMGGILDAAGIDGFLETIDAFKSDIDDDDDKACLMIKKMLEFFPDNEFSLDDFISVSSHGYSGDFAFEIGERAKSEEGRRRAVRDFIKRECLGRPFTVDTPAGKQTVRLTTSRTNSGAHYRLTVLAHKDGS